MRGSRTLQSLFVVISIVFGIGNTYAASGDLDTTFGTGGIATPYKNNTQDIAVQADGKIIAVGHFLCVQNPFSPLYTARKVWRVNTDGTPESVGGQTCSTEYQVTKSDFAAVAIQDDGKIVAAGWETLPGASYSRLIIERFNYDLALDTSFSFDGKVAISFFTGKNASATSIAIQTDGRIVVAGTTATASSSSDAAVVRITQSGLLDTSFNGNGKKTFGFSFSTSVVTEDAVSAVLVMPGTGRIVVTGSTKVTSPSAGDKDFVVVALNSNGTFDTSFGFYGMIITDFYGYDDVSADAVFTGDGIVVGGYSSLSATARAFALVKYRNNGTLDTTFSGDGKYRLAFSAGVSEISSLALDNAGRIICAGAVTSSATGRDFALARINSGGFTDTTFGSSGRVTTNVYNGSGAMGDYANSIALQPDGNIVVGGTSGMLLGGNFVTLARYEQ